MMDHSNDCPYHYSRCASINIETSFAIEAKMTHTTRDVADCLVELGESDILLRDWEGQQEHQLLSSSAAHLVIAQFVVLPSFLFCALEVGTM